MSKFGVLQGVPSVRTYSYDAVCGSANTELPESYILPEHRRPKVSNQGEVGACAAFAIVGILNVFNMIEQVEDAELRDMLTDALVSCLTEHELSEGFFYGYNRSENANYAGMYVEKALDYARETGSVPKVLFDELYEMPEMRSRLMANKNIDKLAEIAKKYRLKGYVGFLRGEKQEIKQAIYENQIPILGVSNSYFGEAHAIMIVGWDKDGFIIQNSWGEDWGEKGLKTVPLTAINYAFMLIDEVLELKFKDVKDSDWYCKAVRECVFNGYMNGMGEDTFAPEGYLTRAQAAQLIVNVQKKNDDINKILSGQISELREELSNLIKWAYTKGYKD